MGITRPEYTPEVQKALDRIHSSIQIQGLCITAIDGCFHEGDLEEVEKGFTALAISALGAVEKMEEIRRNIREKAREN